MDKSNLSRLFAKNAFANIVSGIGALSFNLLVPAILVRTFDTATFGAWSLCLQVMIYVQLAGFGVQTAVTKYISQAGELMDYNHQRRTITGAIQILSVSILVTIPIVLLMAFMFQNFFPGIQKQLQGSVQVAVGVLGFAAALQLLVLVPNGVFVGLHENIHPAVYQNMSRILALCGIYAATKMQLSMVQISIIYALGIVSVLPMSYIKMFQHKLKFKLLFDSELPKQRNELIHYGAALSVWSFSMLLVNGFDIAIVGRVEIKAVAAYALASTLIGAFVGVLNAVFSPLVAIGAALDANSETRIKIPQLLIRTTAITTMIGFASVLMTVYIGLPIIKLWVGIGLVGDTYNFLILLLIANSIRNILLPYSLLLLSTNMHKTSLTTAFLEGATNFSVSIILGLKFGAIGVAWGTIIGSLVGVIGSAIVNFKKTTNLIPSTYKFFVKGVLLPASCFELVGIIIKNIDASFVR